MNEHLVAAIDKYADQYCHENLTEDPQALESDWWRAFDFFLGRACYQGRSDVLSDRVYECALEALQPLFLSDVQRDLNYESQKLGNWTEINTRLCERIGKGKVGKARDVEMIISALQFIGALPNKNIVAYSVKKITDGQLQPHYKQLQRSEEIDGIRQVGPKVAALYLRDVASLFQLTDSVDDSSAFCLQPVDTWVQQIAKRLKVVDEEADKQTTQCAIAKWCHEQRISPIRFNQGAWYMGYHALDLLMDLLSK
jgi:hypothetical protein